MWGGDHKKKSETKSGSPAPATVAPDGKLSFPYPAEASEHTPTICNFSGKTYWFTFEDTGKEEWSEGKGYVCVHPQTNLKKKKQKKRALKIHTQQNSRVS